MYHLRGETKDLAELPLRDDAVRSRRRGRGRRALAPHDASRRAVTRDPARAANGSGRARAAQRIPGRYCSTDCQRIDWRDRGHRTACKKIRHERAAEVARAEAAQAEAPPSAPPPTPEVVYGPAPRSHADEVRARIAAEHEAARLRREANPEPEPVNARYGSRCPICLEKWDVNEPNVLRVCCCRTVCRWCDKKIKMKEPCPLCRAPAIKSEAEALKILRRHVDNEQPEAISSLGDAYRDGNFGLVKSAKKAAKLYKRAVELGNVDAMIHLGLLYSYGREGVRQDKKKTVQLYRMAASRGLAIGQQNLATELRELRCEEEAFRFYKLAVEQGLITAMTDLGCCYECGVGVAQDLDEALRLHTRAVATCKETARRRFEQYYTRDNYVAERDSVARTAQFGLDRITQTLAARRRQY